MSEHSPPKKCPRIDVEEIPLLSKEELLKQCRKQQEQIEQLKIKLNFHAEDDNSEKSKNTPETSRRENVLVMRLTNKEQEVQEYVAQINHNKKVQEDAALLSLQQTNLDPGINLLFGKMREELQQTKSKLEQAQSELSAWKFTPDSLNGKKLIARCRTLIAENQDLGRQLSQGKTAQLEAELALQKKYSDELKASQDELNEFVIQLDEEVEGMQSTIQVLQQQLLAAKRENDNYKRILDAYKSDLSPDDEREFLGKSLQKEPVQSAATVSDDESDAENAARVSNFSPSAESVDRTNNPYYHSLSDSNKDPNSDTDYPTNSETIRRVARTPSRENDRTRSPSISPRRCDAENEFKVCDEWDDKTSTNGDGSNSRSDANEEVDNHEILSNASYDDHTTAHAFISSRDYSSGDENIDSNHRIRHYNVDSNSSRSSDDAATSIVDSSVQFNSNPDSQNSINVNSNDTLAHTADQTDLNTDQSSSLLAYCKKMLSQALCETTADKTVLADISRKLSTFTADGDKELDLKSLQLLKKAIQSLLQAHSDGSTNEDNHYDSPAASQNGLDNVDSR